MRKKIKNIGNYREKVMRASGIYNDAIMREEYTAAVVAAGQCVEGCMKMFLTLSQNPKKMEAAEYSWEAAHTAGWFALQIARVLNLKEISLVF